MIFVGKHIIILAVVLAILGVLFALSTKGQEVEDIVLLKPPPEGYEYAKPEPINIAGETYWIANILNPVKPSPWQRVKDNVEWIAGILGSLAAGLGALKWLHGKKA